jgi:hypothetical protein
MNPASDHVQVRGGIKSKAGHKRLCLCYLPRVNDILDPFSSKLFYNFNRIEAFNTALSISSISSQYTKLDTAE